jgi:SPP1 family predicted phage head-tail adaptor
MKLPKQPNGVRYLGASDFNSYITITQPNSGNAVDGTPLPETTVAPNIHANINQWRGKQEQKTDALQAQSSYKIIIRYPQTYTLDTGMNILVRGQRHNIESFSDPDGQRVELHIWTWVGNDTVNN